VIQALLIVIFFPYQIVQFHQKLMAIKQFGSGLIWVLGQNLFSHLYLKIDLLIGIGHN
jgi:hypothetical protein